MAEEVEPTPTPARATYRPHAATYQVSGRRYVSQGEGPEIETGLRYSVSVELSEEGPQTEASFTVDSVLEVWGSGLRGRTASAVGYEFKGTLDSGGHVAFEEKPDDRDPVLVFLFNNLKELLPALPQAGVSPRQEWADTTESDVLQEDAELRATQVRSFRASEWETVDGSFLLPLGWSGEITISGSGEQLGQQYMVEAAGTVSGRAMISQSGAIVEGFRQAAWRGHITVVSSGFEVAFSQTVADTVRIVSQW